MSYNLSSDAGGAAAPSWPGISAANLLRLRFGSLVLLALLFLFLLLWWANGVYTDWLWFGQLGFRSVYAKVLFLKVWLFASGALVPALLLSFNLYLALRLSRGESARSLDQDTARLLWAAVVVVAALTVGIASLVFGLAASGRWETFLLFFNRVSFGVSDPQFGLDLSFYVVTLRLLHFIQGWSLGLIITTLVASVALYLAVFSLRGVGLNLTPRMLNHVAALGVFLMLSIAIGHALNVYELVLSHKGAVPGATYADVNARLPVLWLLTGIAALAAAGMGASYYFGGLRLMLGAFSLWVIMALLAGLAYPALFQRFQVDPDELAKERPYILRNMVATRAAFQLDQIQEVPYSAAGRLDPQAIQSNRPTVDNIRLWDLQPLQDAYNQIQFMELYYHFLNMDVDRYMVDGRLRQVLVSARELDPGNLPSDARNWVNQRLQYTHGYGLAMSPATGFTPSEGRPQFLLQDIPIRGLFPVARPELYYSESPVNFTIVNSAIPEVNPRAEFQHYDGAGDVAIGSTIRRLAYSWQFADFNIAISDQVTADSRIQYRRRIKDRVGAIAPFLRLDRDPYPVLDDQGKVWWLQDAYTVTDRYPYSTPHSPPFPRGDNRGGAGQFNYIRNSVKVAVDAYNGYVRFYAMDTEDPLLQMYRKAFPALFDESNVMPPVLRDHIRYPRDMFSAQAQMYLRYHVTDTQVFFNQAEQWAIPQETRFGKGGVQVEPVYLVMRLTGEEKEEFVLMLPFTPAGGKKNLVGWLTARNDGPHYGQLLSFQLPRDRQVDGPGQVEARIENNQQISQQFTLWEGAGSEIIRGQLLVIPIADTIIYVEPLYLQSQGLAFPELKKIILADASSIAMADTIDQGLALLVGVPSFTPPVAGLANAESPATQQELDRVQEGIKGLRRALDNLEEALKNLRDTLGGGSP